VTNSGSDREQLASAGPSEDGEPSVASNTCPHNQTQWGIGGKQATEMAATRETGDRLSITRAAAGCVAALVENGSTFVEPCSSISILRHCNRPLLFEPFPKGQISRKCEAKAREPDVPATTFVAKRQSRWNIRYPIFTVDNHHPLLDRESAISLDNLGALKNEFH
jgi:hypothetical protein